MNMMTAHDNDTIEKTQSIEGQNIFNVKNL